MSKREKLNINQVIEILTVHKDLPSRKIAEMYRVSRTCITDLRRGWTWVAQLTMLIEVGILPKDLWKPDREALKKYTKKQDQILSKEKQIPVIHRPDPFRPNPIVVQRSFSNPG